LRIHKKHYQWVLQVMKSLYRITAWMQLQQNPN
jgi:hypothetical protein